MNTPTGTRADEPIDGQVRNLLWRLRAHAVTPPAEQRVQADLDRLLSAARVQAHLAPSEGAVARPLVDAEAGFVTPDHPLHPPQAVPDTEVASLAEARTRRAWTPGRAVGRVAAAMVVVLVASGAAGARDGVVHLQALLGRGDVPVAMDAAEDILPIPTAAGEVDRSTGDADASDPELDTGSTPPTAGESTEGNESTPSGTSEEVVESAEARTTETEPEPRSTTDTAGTGSTDAPSAGTSSGGSSTGASSDGSGSKAPAPKPDAPKSDTPKTDAVESEPDEPILAAPVEPEDVLGAGGPRGCGTEKLADCLPSEDDDATDDPDPSAKDKPSASKADDLAQRRFQKPPSGPSQVPQEAGTDED